jgi:hypothetical protein
MITVRPFNRETDYELFVQWWIGHDFSPVPLEVLPALGIVAEHHGKLAAAAWLYLDSSTPVGMLEWIVTNPTNNPKISAIAITHVIQALRFSAMENGHTVILSSCRQESLARLMERLGFQETDKNVTHLVSILNPAEES